MRELVGGRVLEMDPDRVAHLDPDHGTRDRAVERPDRLHESWRHGHLGLCHDEVDVMGGPGQECRGGRVVGHGRRSIRVGGDVGRRHRPAMAVAAGGRGALDGHRTLHARLGMPGDRADEGQAAGRYVHVDRLHSPGVDVPGRGAVGEGEVVRDLARVREGEGVAAGGVDRHVPRREAEVDRLEVDLADDGADPRVARLRGSRGRRADSDGSGFRGLGNRERPGRRGRRGTCHRDHGRRQDHQPKGGGSAHRSGPHTSSRKHILPRYVKC